MMAPHWVFLHFAFTKSDCASTGELLAMVPVAVLELANVVADMARSGKREKIFSVNFTFPLCNLGDIFLLSSNS